MILLPADATFTLFMLMTTVLDRHDCPRIDGSVRSREGILAPSVATDTMTWEGGADHCREGSRRGRNGTAGTAGGGGLSDEEVHAAPCGARQ